MNLLLLEDRDFAGKDTAEISGRRAEQLRKVIKLAPGECCKAGRLGGKIGTAQLLEDDGERMRLTCVFSDLPPPPLPVTLVAALQRPNTFDKILHTATVMGVKHFCFIGARKVEKSYWQSSALEPEAIRETLLLALEQGGDTVLPKLEFYPRFKPFAEDVLPGLLEERRGVCAHPSAEKSISAFPGGPATLLVGPEGGFTDYEVGRIREAGAEIYSMGRRILRSEFAVTALLTGWMLNEKY